MNIDEAKKILIAYRRGSRDIDDSEVTEALSAARQMPELQAWLDQQAHRHSTIRAAFRDIPVPDDLADRILAGSNVVIVPRAAWMRREVLACAAMIAAMLILLFFFSRTVSSSDSFEIFRSRMVRSVLREYRMDIVTNDIVQIRGFLARNQAPADYILSEKLTSFSPVGGGVLSWQDRRVSMVCLDSGRTNMLFLFVVDRDGMRHPPTIAPAFAKVNKLMTASWSQGDKVFLLAADMSQGDLNAMIAR